MNTLTDFQCWKELYEQVENKVQKSYLEKVESLVEFRKWEIANMIYQDEGIGVENKTHKDQLYWKFKQGEKEYQDWKRILEWLKGVRPHHGM